MIKFMNIAADSKINVAKILRGGDNIDKMVAVASDFLGKSRRQKKPIMSIKELLTLVNTDNAIGDVIGFAQVMPADNSLIIIRKIKR